jgi:hypothetical protein
VWFDITNSYVNDSDLTIFRSAVEFHEYYLSGCRVVPCVQTDGQTDVTKLIVAFCNFANAPTNKAASTQIPNTVFWLRYIHGTHHRWRLCMCSPLRHSLYPGVEKLLSWRLWTFIHRCHWNTTSWRREGDGGGPRGVRINHLGTRSRWVISFTSRHLWPCGEMPRRNLWGRGWVGCRAGMFPAEDRRNLLLELGPLFLGCPAGKHNRYTGLHANNTGMG